MPASPQTVKQAVKILIEEVGREKAFSIVNRLYNETEGNASYNETIRRLFKAVDDYLIATRKQA